MGMTLSDSPWSLQSRVAVAHAAATVVCALALSSALLLAPSAATAAAAHAAMQSDVAQRLLMPAVAERAAEDDVWEVVLAVLKVCMASAAALSGALLYRWWSRAHVPTAALGVVLLLAAGLAGVTVVVINFGLFVAIYTCCCAPLLLLPMAAWWPEGAGGTAGHRAVTRTLASLASLTSLATHPLTLLVASALVSPTQTADVCLQARTLDAVGVWLHTFVLAVWVPLSTLTAASALGCL